MSIHKKTPQQAFTNTVILKFLSTKHPVILTQSPLAAYKELKKSNQSVNYNYKYYLSPIKYNYYLRFRKKGINRKNKKYSVTL